MSAIVVSDDIKLIVTGPCDGSVRGWDARNGKAIGKPKQHFTYVRDLPRSTVGSVIVSGHGDFSLLRWNA